MYTRNYTRCTINELCLRGFYTKSELAKKMGVKMETLELYMGDGGVYPDTIKKIERVIHAELKVVESLYSHIPREYCIAKGLNKILIDMLEETGSSKRNLSIMLNVPIHHVYQCCDNKPLSPSTIKSLALALSEYFKPLNNIVS